MGIGEIVYSLITLLVIFLIMFSPLIKKIMKAAEGRPETGDRRPDIQGRVSEESIYESVDSHRVVKRILREDDTVRSVEFTEPEPVKYKKGESASVKGNVIQKIDKMATLKKAVIWKEILSSPVALRDPGRDDFI